MVIIITEQIIAVNVIINVKLAADLATTVVRAVLKIIT